MIHIKTSYDNRQGFIKLDFSGVDICSSDNVTEALIRLRETVSESFLAQIEMIKGDSNFLCPEDEINYGDDFIQQ